MSKVVLFEGVFTLFCPKCGSDEWDHITNRVAPGESFQRCYRCDHEWQADQEPTVLPIAGTGGQ